MSNKEALEIMDDAALLFMEATAKVTSAFHLVTDSDARDGLSSLSDAIDKTYNDFRKVMKILSDKDDGDVNGQGGSKLG